MTTTTAMRTTAMMLKMMMMINCWPISTFPNDSEARFVDRIHMFLLMVDDDNLKLRQTNLPHIDENDVQAFLGE